MTTTAAATAKAKDADDGRAGAARAGLSGMKLAQASLHLRDARKALIDWTRELYANRAEEKGIEDLMEVLDWAHRLEDLRFKISAKGSVFGVDH